MSGHRFNSDPRALADCAFAWQYVPVVRWMHRLFDWDANPFR